MLTIDGSFGEGGGQILRSSLALSMVTRRAIRISKIRAGRKKPGLLRQHLTAVKMASMVCRAQTSGAELGSTELTFEPGPVTPGHYELSVGSAGSATLVMQTVLPALLVAEGPSSLTLGGGTYNPFAPPFDFLVKAYLPMVNRMGPRVDATLERPGFFPAGGGRFHVSVTPAKELTPVSIAERGEITKRCARALVANLPRTIAEREVKLVTKRMGWAPECLIVEETKNSLGPGNVVMIELTSEHLTEVFSAFGEVGVTAEAVADEAVDQCRRYLAADVPVGEYLADQLLLPLALAGGGSFKTLSLSRHSTTHIELIQKFLEVGVETRDTGRDNVLVTIRK
jgi:RNA 3'-terminal phosphate cyclase (ATP)